MRKLTYSGVDCNGLHDQLIAAGIVPTYVGGVADDDTGVEIVVPDEVGEAAVAAVVAAHDRAACLAARQATDDAARQDVANIKTFMKAANNTITLPMLVAVVKALVRVVARRVFRELDD